MGTEIERKFLVTGDGWRRGKRSRLSQGYLCASLDRSVRVRLEDGVGTLNVKGPAKGLARAEFEYRIPRKDAAALLTLWPAIALSSWFVVWKAEISALRLWAPVVMIGTAAAVTAFVLTRPTSED